jgi:hypothetical protein
MSAFTPVPDEYLKEAADLLDQYGSQVRAAAAATKLDEAHNPCGIGIARSTFQARLNRAASRGLMGADPVLPGFRISQTSTTSDGDGKKLRQSVQQKEERGPKFVPPEGFRLTALSALTTGDGHLIQAWNKLSESRDPIDIIAACKAAVEGWGGTAPVAKAPSLYSNDLLTLIPCNDWHLGMSAWGAETQTNWDLKIAEDVIGAAIESVISRTPPSAVAVILGGGDLIHADNNENKTARSGNALQVDGRYQKIVGVACRLKVRVIDAALRQHKQVVVRVLPGNHDEHAAVAVAYFLSAWYRNEPRVTVDLDPSLFWWYRFGKVLLGSTHGHSVKIQRMAGIMAARRAEDWGKAKYKFVHGFHLHHRAKIADEDNGVISEIHQAPIPPDGWHWGAGFLSGRSLQAITYDKQRGERGRVVETLLDDVTEGSAR